MAPVALLYLKTQEISRDCCNCFEETTLMVRFPMLFHCSLVFSLNKKQCCWVLGLKAELRNEKPVFFPLVGGSGCPETLALFDRALVVAMVDNGRVTGIIND